MRNTRSKRELAEYEEEEKEAETERRPSTWRRFLSGLKLFLCALALGAVMTIGAVGYLSSLQESGPAITSSILKEELKYVKDLVTVEYRYSNADKATFPGRVLLGQNIPFTGKSFIVTYDGVIKYGVDISAVEIDVDEYAKTVRVTIPQSKLISHEIPDSSFKALDERNGLFNSIRIDDVTAFRKEQKAAMEKKAEEQGMPRQAQEQSGAAIEALLRATPGMDEYQLSVKYE